jgi:hypothetical protein
MEQLALEPEFREVIDLPKEPVVEVRVGGGERVDPPLKLIIDGIMRRTTRFKVYRPRQKPAELESGKDWLERIYERLRSNLRSN